MKIDISEDNLATLCTCAIRYCHGRQSYMPKLVQDICRGFLPKFSNKTLKVMLQDCEFQRKMNLYGSPTIDKPDWLKWEQDLKDEYERRKK